MNSLNRLCYFQGHILTKYVNNFKCKHNMRSMNLVRHFYSNTSYSTKIPFYKFQLFKTGLLGITAGAAIGTAYTLYKMNEASRHMEHEVSQIPFLDFKEVPKINPSRQIIYPTDPSGLKLTLYQYQTCPFCCKVRAFLDYYGISYDIVEVDPVLRQSIKWSSYKKVPIILAKADKGYQQLNDSSMIISAIFSFIKDRTKELPEFVEFYPNITYFDETGLKKEEILNRYFLMYPDAFPKYRTKEDVLEERKWRKWADETLVHVLSPNVYRTHQEALQAFNWFSVVGEWEKNFPAWERYLIIYVGAFAMWLIGKRLKKRHSLKGDVRESLYDECNYWIKALKKKGTPFMGGSKPNLSDISVYGILSSIEGCDAFQDILKNSNIGPWYNEMKNNVTDHKGRVELLESLQHHFRVHQYHSTQ